MTAEDIASLTSTKELEDFLIACVLADNALTSEEKIMHLQAIEIAFSTKA